MDDDTRGMKAFTFSECRKIIEINEGFSDDNIIYTDGELSDLPALKFLRHGNLKNKVSGCSFKIPCSTRGRMNFFLSSDQTHVRIGPYTRIIANFRLWRKPTVSIGSYVTINSANFVADKSDIIVGSDCMFSDEILVQSSDQHGLWDIEQEVLLNGNRRAVTINDHVWVGRAVKIMPDVTIGAGTTLGTGSIVTKNIPPCSIAVGIPAKVVKSKTSWSRLPNTLNQREKSFFEQARKAHYWADECKTDAQSAPSP